MFERQKETHRSMSLTHPYTFCLGLREAKSEVQ